MRHRAVSIPYRPEYVQKIKLDALDEVTMKGLYLIVKKPLFMPRIDYERVWGKVDESKTQWETIVSRFAAHVVEWNLIDPETGDSLPLPTEVDPSPLDRVPYQIIEFVTYELSGMMQETAQSALKASSHGIFRSLVEIETGQEAEMKKETKPNQKQKDEAGEDDPGDRGAGDRGAGDGGEHEGDTASPQLIDLTLTDIELAFRFNTTPWDVRENLTYYDLMRIRAIDKAQEEKTKVSDAEDAVKQRLGISSSSGRGRSSARTRTPRSHARASRSGRARRR